MRKKSRLLVTLPVLWLSACAPLPPPAATNTTAPPPVPWTEPPDHRQPGLQWRIAPDSEIAVTVRRGGAFARLGHDHVVAVRGLEGRATAGSAGEPAHAVFRFRLDAMEVDNGDMRAKAGLDSTPSADAIAGTRHNMLVKVLDAEHYPEVLVQATQSGPAELQADITLHGVTRRYTIPAEIRRGADGQGGISASGTFTLRQTDFGITPFSVLGGALAVQDTLELRFAVRAAPGG